MPELPVETAYAPWMIALAAVAALLLIILFWVWRKGRPLAGAHVFRASRLSRGNRLFPSQVAISPSSITLYKAQWIGKLEESVHLAHVASIRIDTHVVFSDVFIETSGGHNPLACHGHTKGDAVKMKQMIEEFQTQYYKGKTS